MDVTQLECNRLFTAIVPGNLIPDGSVPDFVSQQYLANLETSVPDGVQVPSRNNFSLFLSVLLVFRLKTNVLRRPMLLFLHIRYNICKYADGIEHGTDRNWRVSLCAKALSNVDC